jgi:hypothetical protein
LHGEASTFLTEVLQSPSSFEQEEYQVTLLQTMQGSANAVECLTKAAKIRINEEFKKQYGR